MRVLLTTRRNTMVVKGVIMDLGGTLIGSLANAHKPTHAHSNVDSLRHTLTHTYTPLHTHAQMYLYKNHTITRDA